MKEFKSFYKTVGGGEGDRCNYPTRLDTYGCGCQHDCSYCYAKSLLDFRGLWDAKEPSVADITKIRKKISKFKKGEIVRLGGMTDCFQPLERIYKVTYNTIKALNEAGVGYLIVTKSDLVADDEYMEILDKDLAHIQISVTSTSDSTAATYEKAVPPSRRIAAIEKLQANGFDVQLRLSPFIPEYIDMDIINDVKCDKILVEFLRVNHWIEKWFDLDFSEYTFNHGGYKHMGLDKKKKYLSELNFKEITVCEDVDSHYEYWKTHINANKEDCCNLRR